MENNSAASIVKDLGLVIIRSRDIFNVSVTLLKLMKKYKASREGRYPDEDTPSSSRTVASRTSNMKKRSLRLTTATNAHNKRHLAIKYPMAKPCSSMAEFSFTAALVEHLYHVWKNQLKARKPSKILPDTSTSSSLLVRPMQLNPLSLTLRILRCAFFWTILQLCVTQTTVVLPSPILSLQWAKLSENFTWRSTE